MPSVISVGSRVGGYTVLHLLGQGGMGQVYLAQHHRIARRAAVKVLLPELSANERSSSASSPRRARRR